MADISVATPSSNAAVFYSKRRGSATPLSPSALPDITILPQPYAADKVLVGQLVSASSTHNPTVLEDRDFDDGGARWYKDVILIDGQTGKFKESCGGVLYLQKEPEAGVEVGTIEAREMRVRLLKNADAAFKKVLEDDDTKAWLKEHAQKGDVGFVTAVREVTNASYKHAHLVDRGASSWEVVREVSGEGADGKRRGSELAVPDTGSKTDIVGVVVRKIVLEGGQPKVGEEMGTEFWN